DIDVGIMITVDVSNRECRSVLNREDSLGWRECPVSALKAYGDRGRGERNEVRAAVVIDVDHDGVHGVHGGAEDRGHIRETMPLVILEEAETTGVRADQKVRPAVAIVVDGARGSCSDVEIESHGRGVDKRALPGVEVEPVYGGQAVRAKRIGAVEDVRIAVIVRVQDGTVPAAPPRVRHIPLIGLIDERAVRLLDIERIRFHRTAAISPNTAENIFPAVPVEISGQAVVPVSVA